MKVNELIRKLENMRDDLNEKDIVIGAENGVLLPLEIKFKLKNPYDALNLSDENVECIVITW